MPRPSRLGLALAATVAASSLFVGGGLAAAAPTACEAEQTAVTNATADTKAAAEKALADCQAALQTSTTTTTTTTTTTSKAPDQNRPPPSEGGRPPNGGDGRPGDGRPGDGRPGDRGDGYQKPSSYKPWKGDKGNPRRDRNDRPRRAGDEKDCRDFDNRDEAQSWYKGHGKPGDKDPSRLDRDRDGRACENDDDDGDDSEPVIPPNVDVTVIINQTEDDGSEATTSGEQVKQVPEGSVDTGSAQ